MQEERRGGGGGKVGKGGGGGRGRGGGGGEIQRASALHDPAKLNNFDARRQQENLGNSGTRSEWEYSPPYVSLKRRLTPFPTTRQPKTHREPPPSSSSSSAFTPGRLSSGQTRAPPIQLRDEIFMAEKEAAGAAGAAEEAVCTFLCAVCTGGTLGAGEVFGAARLRRRRAPEEEEKSVQQKQGNSV